MSKTEDDEGKKIFKTYHEVGPYLGLGFQLAASIILMFFLGWWLDKQFQITPILTIVFSFIGGFAGIYSVIKAVLELNQKKKNDPHR